MLLPVSKTQDALEDVGVYAAVARKTTRDQFSATYKEPLLLIDPFEVEEESGFLTVANRSAAGLTPRIARVKKRPGSNAFASMITVGRAANNDIIIAAGAISKFHFYLMQSPTGEITVSDAGSSNGTIVDGKKLNPRTERLPLKAPAEILLGGLKVTFHTAATLYDHLQRQMNPRPA
jgi:pSer/pThr/pTyr-binding forkhead associated (FHA) protein